MVGSTGCSHAKEVVWPRTHGGVPCRHNDRKGIWREVGSGRGDAVRSGLSWFLKMSPVWGGHPSCSDPDPGMSRMGEIRRLEPVSRTVVLPRKAAYSWTWLWPLCQALVHTHVIGAQVGLLLSSWWWFGGTQNCHPGGGVSAVAEANVMTTGPRCNGPAAPLSAELCWTRCPSWLFLARSHWPALRHSDYGAVNLLPVAGTVGQGAAAWRAHSPTSGKSVGQAADWGAGPSHLTTSLVSVDVHQREEGPLGESGGRLSVARPCECRRPSLWVWKGP